MRIILFLITSLFTVSLLTGQQCVYNTQTKIKDEIGKLDTTRIYTIVDGVTSDDLSSPSQKVCVVRLAFAHEFVGDLYVDLVSPAGQRVRLIGAGVQTSPLTDLVRWNVQFFACDLPAIPDPGFNARWDNSNLWLSPKQYSGTYHPYEGCFADLNTGSVNGLWTLEFIDQSDNGSGELSEFEIVFCENEGRNCEVCDPGIHRLNQEELSICQNNDNFSLEPIYMGETPNNNIYEYKYLVSKEGLFDTIVGRNELKELPVGTYTLCGLSYLSIEASRIAELQKGMKIEEVDQFVLENNICLSRSTNCVAFSVQLAPEIVRISKLICEGQHYEVGGKKYYEPGSYEIVVPATPCDSVSYLDLVVVPNPYGNIFSTVEKLSCDQNSAILSIDLPKDVQIEWSTEDGDFIPNSLDSTKIFALKGGTYYVTLDDGNCQFVNSYTLNEADDFVYIKVDFEELSCVNRQTEVQLISNEINSVQWSSENTFTQVGNNILVETPGVYQVILRAGNCRLEKFVDVKGTPGLAGLSVENKNLTCNEPTDTLEIKNSSSFNYTYKWYKEQIFLGKGNKLKVDETGLYTVIAAGNASCLDTLNVEVKELKQNIDVNLNVENITCEQSVAMATFTTPVDENTFTFQWLDPQGQVYTERNYSTAILGRHSLLIKNELGCVDTTMFFVKEDVEPADVEIRARQFECAEDSIQIRLSGVKSLDEISWTGLNFSSNERNPWVDRAGIYTVTVRSENGCRTEKSYEVRNGSNIPETIFEYGDLTCESPTQRIVPTNRNLTYLWTNQEGQITEEIDYEVVSPGIYDVEYTDAFGCKARETIFIGIDTTHTLPEISANNLTCTDTIAILSLESEQTFRSKVWKSANGDIVNDTVKVAGWYLVDYIYDSNGCSGKDSVEVILNDSLPQVDFVSAETLSCNIVSTTLEATVDINNSKVEWKDVNGKIYEGPKIETNVPGLYEVKVVAPNSCQVTESYTVEIDTTKVVPMVAITSDNVQVSCIDTFVDIQAFIPPNNSMDVVDSRWEGSSFKEEQDFFATVQKGGVYKFVVVTENGCEGLDSIKIESIVKLPEYTIDKDTINCVVSDAKFEVVTDAAENTIEWTNTNLTGYSSSTTEPISYSFKLTNDLQCIVEDSVVIVVDTIHPVAKINKSNDLNCKLTTTTLNVINSELTNVNYIWNGGSTVDQNDTAITVTAPGIYELQALGNNGCSTVDTIEVIQDIDKPIINTPDRMLGCRAGKISLLVEHDLPVLKYQWSGVDGFSSEEKEPIVIKLGKYKVIVTGENQCTASDSLIVSSATVLPVLEVENAYLPCDDGNVFVIPKEITKGAVVSWFGPNNFYSEGDVLETRGVGVYEAIAVDENQCIVRDSFEIIDKPIYPKYKTEISPIYCTEKGKLSIVNQDDGVIASWIGIDTTFIGSTILTNISGDYQLIVTGSNACKDTMQLSLTDFRTELEAEIKQLSPFQCENTKFFLSTDILKDSLTTSTYLYDWSTEDGKILNAVNKRKILVEGEGTYKVSITNNTTGCTTSADLLVEKEEQTFNEVQIDVTPPTCYGFDNGKISFTNMQGGTPPYTVEIDGNKYGNNLYVEYLKVGDHNVKIIDSLGCSLEYIRTIPEGKYPNVTLPNDTIVNLGDSLNITPIFYPDYASLDVMWNTETACDTCPYLSILPFYTQQIIVTVTDSIGCKAVDTVNVRINKPNLRIFPNVFSPNDDGINDYFYLPYTKGIDRISRLSVYDWDGKKVFSVSEMPLGEQEKGWDGRFNGEYVLQGVYMYEVTLELDDGRIITEVGDVTVLR